MLQQSFNSLCPHLDPHPMDCLYIDTPAFQGLVDLYCPDPTCHCHKVSIVVINPHNVTYTTIAYGWKNPPFYQKWGLDFETSYQLTLGFLDPIAAQSNQAPLFLDAFLKLKRQTAFIRRFKQRYTLFKNYLQQKQINNVLPFKTNTP